MEENRLPQLYRWEHVVTHEELISIYQGFYFQWEETQWWEIYRRQQLKYIMAGIDAVIRWVEQGKRIDKEIV